LRSSGAFLGFVPNIHSLEFEDESTRHRNIGIPAPNTSNGVFPCSPYHLLCLNRAGMQWGKCVLTKIFLWICTIATGVTQ